MKKILLLAVLCGLAFGTMEAGNKQPTKLDRIEKFSVDTGDAVLSVKLKKVGWRDRLRDRLENWRERRRERLERIRQGLRNLWQRIQDRLNPEPDPEPDPGPVGGGCSTVAACACEAPDVAEGCSRGSDGSYKWICVKPDGSTETCFSQPAPGGK